MDVIDPMPAVITGSFEEAKQWNDRKMLVRRSSPATTQPASRKRALVEGGHINRPQPSGKPHGTNGPWMSQESYLKI
jgi:hypothetical protein